VNTNKSVGKYGEDRASEFLERLGYQVIERNWRCNVGEIDIVAHDQDCLVFAEVKTRTRVGFGHPFEAITSAKMQKMRQLVGEWCRAHDIASVQLRLDAISVLLTGGQVHIEHLKQVF
jgi:putative endonuclease